MAKLGIAITGIVLLGIAVLGYVFPVNDLGWTIPQTNDLCSSAFGQIGQAFSGDIQQICLEFKYMTYGIYGLGLVGIILVIIGSVVPSSSKSKEKTFTCAYCNFVTMSETELFKHNSEKHLDKSPYKCEHCEFIGITEEILWNHYNEKHPNEKKW